MGQTIYVTLPMREYAALKRLEGAALCVSRQDEVWHYANGRTARAALLAALEAVKAAKSP